MCETGYTRKIIHIDLDSYFASIEQRDNPELRGKPIAVGFDGPRGVVSTASYEARRYGVHSAQSMIMARRLCPQLIVVPSRYDVYKEVSRQIHDIFLDYTDLVEPLSLDEAFLDVTACKHDIPLAVDIAREIKQRISDSLQLTASAGISYCKFLAKIASDYRKPNGLYVIHPQRAQQFIDNLPIDKFWGVGKKTAQRMHYMGIFTGIDLRRCPKQHLIEVFGKAGAIFYQFARGIDTRPVTPFHERKSVGCEQTFLHDLTTKASLTINLYHIVLELVERISKTDFSGVTLTLKIRYDDFSQFSRSTTVQYPLKTKQQILPLAKQLLTATDLSRHSVRLLGLAVSNPQASDSDCPANYPIQLFFDF